MVGFFGVVGELCPNIDRLVKIRLDHDGQHKTVMIHASATIGALLKEFGPRGRAREDLQVVMTGCELALSRDMMVGLIDAGPVAPPVELRLHASSTVKTTERLRRQKSDPSN